MSDLTEREMTIEDRIETLEAAVIALARVEMGDVPGHDFHGNQWTGGGRDWTEKNRPLRDKDSSSTGLSPKQQDAIAKQYIDRANAAQNSTTGGKGTDAQRYARAKEEGMIPEHIKTTGYGSNSENAAAVLPTGPSTRLNPRDTEGHEYYSGEGLTIIRSNETGHLRALNDEPRDAFALGATVYLQHDQTGARIGGYSGHDVVGGVFKDGRIEGLVPDKKLPYSVFK